MVTWNCNGALRRKTACLDALNADILVIQECEDPAQYGDDYLDWAGDYAWVGDLRSKGIGVFARNGLTIETLSWKGEDFRLFLPVRIADSFDLVAVWTQSAKPASTGYIGQFWRYLQANRELIGSARILCGDFNSNAIWDKKRQTGNHGQCVSELEELGFQSLYHQATNEQHGMETTPTFHLYRSRERPFHLDYMFVPRGMTESPACKIAIGEAELWLARSDHQPLIADLPL